MKKFRICYTAQNGEKYMIYNDGNYHIGLDGTVYENFGQGGREMWETLFDAGAPEILQQFTGAQDKNRKEIWEGDIIDYGGRKGVVVFFACAFRVNWDDQSDDDLGTMTTDMIEVTGNTFGI